MPKECLYVRALFSLNPRGYSVESTHILTTEGVEALIVCTPGTTSRGPLFWFQRHDGSRNSIPGMVSQSGGLHVTPCQSQWAGEGLEGRQTRGSCLMTLPFITLRREVTTEGLSVIFLKKTGTSIATSWWYCYSARNNVRYLYTTHLCLLQYVACQRVGARYMIELASHPRMYYILLIWCEDCWASHWQPCACLYIKKDMHTQALLTLAGLRILLYIQSVFVSVKYVV